MGVWVWSETPSRWAIFVIVQQKVAILTPFGSIFERLFQVFWKPLEKTKLL